MQVFAGCAWSRQGAVLLDGAVDVRCIQLRKALASTLFHKPAPWTCSSEENLQKSFFQAFMGILTGESTRMAILESTQSTISNENSTLTIADIANAEKLLWGLLAAQNESSTAAVPPKNEAAMCLKLYRHILHTAEWRSNSKGFVSGRSLTLSDLNGECEECFSLLSILGVLCRTVLLASSGAITTGGRLNIPVNPTTLAVETDLHNTNIQKRAAVCDFIDVSQPYIPKVFPKDAQVSAILTNVVQNNILFRNYQADQHTAIVDGFERIHVSLDEILIKQGDPGEYFYIIESGEMDVHMDSGGFKIKVGRTLSTGDYFGELALMYNTPRAATVVCTVPGILWRMSRQTYRTIVTQHSKNTAKEFISLISNVQILGKRLGDVFSVNELNKVVSSLEVEAFEDGACIVRQYLTGDYFYIITEGQVDVYQDKSNRASIPDAQTAYQDPYHTNTTAAAGNIINTIIIIIIIVYYYMYLLLWSTLLLLLQLY